MFKITIAFAVLSAILLCNAHGMEMVNYQQGCVEPGGVGQAPRQTIIVLDEGTIVAGVGSEGPKSATWKRPLLEIADVVDAAPRGNMMPHERLTIYVAKQDGSELAPVFVGCSPNVSSAKREELKKNDSFMNWAFTGGPTRAIEQDRSAFKNALADAIRIIEKSVRSNQSAAKPGALLRSLSTAPHLSELSMGIPRILFISPLNLVENGNWQSEIAARDAGLDLAANSGLNLERAELYVVSTHQAPSEHMRAFMEAFFLRARANLAGWRTDGLPQLLPAPVEVRVFGGAVEMGDVSPPVQIRIAFDSQGTLVNSWIEVTKGRSLATPIFGKAICRTKDNCEIKGDGNLFGQVWNSDRKAPPKFDDKFAWSGCRYFAMSYSGATGDVRIWDPKVRIRIGDRLIDEFRFKVDRTDKQHF